MNNTYINEVGYTFLKLSDNKQIMLPQFSGTESEIIIKKVKWDQVIESLKYYQDMKMNSYDEVLQEQLYMIIEKGLYFRYEYPDVFIGKDYMQKLKESI